MKFPKSTVITVNATPNGAPIGDQATLRGAKVLALVVLAGNAPDGTVLANLASTFITLQTQAGRLIHQDLSLALLAPAYNAGIVHELGGEAIDWTKSTVRGTGLVAFSVIYE